jgi:putative hydrolase of the HAD superfamily
MRACSSRWGHSAATDRFERGQVSEDEFHRGFQELIGREVCPQELYRAGSDIFWLNEPMVPVLEKLRSEGYRMVLLSNTTAAHLRFIRENFPVLDFMDELVLSYEVGAMKPEDAIYEAALDRIFCPPENCLYLDDIAMNIEGGRRFGLRAEVYTDTSKFLRDLQTHGVELSL